MKEYRVLDRIAGPADIKHLSDPDLAYLAKDLQCQQKQLLQLNMIFQYVQIFEMTISNVLYQQISQHFYRC